MGDRATLLFFGVFMLQDRQQCPQAVSYTELSPHAQSYHLNMGAALLSAMAALPYR